MSTKQSILLTKDNEHWYYDGADDTFYIEFEPKHLIGNELVVRCNTDLYRELRKLQMKLYRAPDLSIADEGE